ncbi:hypothetical protein C8D70_11021 [Chryseobacterium sp. CBTAP 102]|uniref:helix-turn-helix domain-containing protein n=1 Tax=Chryseobacterium sp. CBTAP 102 TaxID=2135644 RepID=UPI000D7718EC|nr:helix-turn-helix domain-containing protein [Chryseobacterium sp. CBTAP 102]PXW12929.1 hypothetical protein C8D70_11021 [Chryseobacterium sp. CBTAP 102]
MENKSPHFKIIFLDILNEEFPEKIQECSTILAKDSLTSLDVLVLNKIIFGQSKNLKDKNVYRSYTLEDIKYILNYQKKNNLNNSEVCIIFGTSRNTIAKWKTFYSKL